MFIKQQQTKSFFFLLLLSVSLTLLLLPQTTQANARSRRQLLSQKQAEHNSQKVIGWDAVYVKAISLGQTPNQADKTATDYINNQNAQSNQATKKRRSVKLDDGTVVSEEEFRSKTVRSTTNEEVTENQSKPDWRVHPNSDADLFVDIGNGQKRRVAPPIAKSK
eukprot:Nk52_evm1s556 gene=Nk52_evmTU1s556